MKLIVGLGNPGKRYEKTRHNVGYVVIDKLAQVFGINNYELSKKARAEYVWVKLNGSKVELVKPQTMMNESGFSVSYILRKHRELKISDIYVIHDDLDIKLGEYKIQKSKGPHDHKGLNSIYDKIGTKNFWHIRIGVENRKRRPGDNNQERVGESSFNEAMEGKDYVLQSFTDVELDILDKVIENIVKELTRDVLN
jgi:PTH1 family peptidyl-tRNA hydrolase